MCFGFKEWHLLSRGNSFYCGSGGEEAISLDVILERGYQTFVTKCGKMAGVNVTLKSCDVIYGLPHRQKSRDGPLRHSVSPYQYAHR
jgi:hypothetical protein